VKHLAEGKVDDEASRQDRMEVPTIGIDPFPSKRKKPQKEGERIPDKRGKGN
jgi:hypothetical protein